MPLGLIVLGVVFTICFTLVILKYLSKRDVNADIDLLRKELERNRPADDEPRDLRRRL